MYLEDSWLFEIGYEDTALRRIAYPRTGQRMFDAESGVSWYNVIGSGRRRLHMQGLIYAGGPKEEMHDKQ
jgi:hypothetical protein